MTRLRVRQFPPFVRDMMADAGLEPTASFKLCRGYWVPISEDHAVNLARLRARLGVEFETADESQTVELMNQIAKGWNETQTQETTGAPI